MQSLFRVINIAFSPVLTLLFASRFAGFTIAGRDAGNELGGVVAGLLVLFVELALTQGPKHSARLRRWLEPRSVFEGVWLQDVFEGVWLQDAVEGPRGNAVGVFSLDYVRGHDEFSVRGSAYSAEGLRSATWHSTHMFIDAGSLKATYSWSGERLGQPTPAADKSGITELVLRRPPVFSLPVTGDGRVSHVGEETRMKFQMRRVTARYLIELGLPFTPRELRVNANDEEVKLVSALLRQRAGR